MVSALVTRARVEARRGDWRAALATLDQALIIAPDHAHARHQRGLLAMTCGDFATGWSDAEARRSLAWHRQAAPRDLPAWDGVVRPRQTLVVWGEQGLGDQLQFVRFVPELVRRTSARVIVQVAPSLCRLFAERWPSLEIAPLGAPVPADAAHVPMMSLPWLLGITRESDLTGAPYLSAADPQPRGTSRPRVGVCWAGNPRHRHDRARSISLDAVSALVSAVDVEWISLQIGSSERARVAHPLLSRTIGAAPLSADDFAATAQVMHTLDAIVTVDTAVAHLAGALGVPTWVLVAPLPDWRWQRERHDSPWYRSVRVVRRHAAEQWCDVMPRAAAELSRYLRNNADVVAA
jgi:hypothetical protein